MPSFQTAARTLLAGAALLACLAGWTPPAAAQASAAPAASLPPKAAAKPHDKRYVAPGFAGLQADDSIVLMPVDVELFSMSAGGVLEPKADWTAAAGQHLRAAIAERKAQLKLRSSSLEEQAADDFAEQLALHAAVAQSVALHHSIGGVWALPTKAGVLDWNFGDAMQALAARTGARYGLFVWVRDSYASAERKAAMVLLAIAGVGVSGGAQVGYASLIDLDSGQLVWFNQLARGSGDLREADSARETMGVLLTGFPAPR